MTAVDPGRVESADADVDADADTIANASLEWTPPALSAPSVTRVVVDVDGIPMSALLCEAWRPRGVIVALHGGAAMSAYFDDLDRPRHSLLRIGAALGFSVVALDRPGYGNSAAYAGDMTAPEDRVDLTYGAVERILESRSRGAGMFLLGHSIGCETVLRMAGDARGAALLGVELAGTGRHHHPGIQDILEERRDAADTARNQSRALFDLLWKPSHLYPPETIGGARFGSRTPRYEGVVAESWKADFAGLAAGVRVPVHYTLGDHERVWRTGPSALADIAALFTASPRVSAEVLADSGHNLSVGLTATAYHLRVLSFVEECVLRRLNSGSVE